MRYFRNVAEETLPRHLKFNSGKVDTVNKNKNDTTYLILSKQLTITAKESRFFDDINRFLVAENQ